MREGRNVVSGYEASEGALITLFLAFHAEHHQEPVICPVNNADQGLYPRVARALMNNLCQWYLSADQKRQILLTTHNPLVLDGLPLEDDRIRHFTVSRTRYGRTIRSANFD